MSDDSDRTADELQKRRPPLWAIVLALLVLYPLSIGPVFRLSQQITVTVTPDHRNVATSTIPLSVALFYFPLSWLGENIPVVDALLDWYLNLF